MKPHHALGLGALLLCGGVTQAGPHVHGAAELMLAAEGNKVEIILNVPAMSVVGFESQAVSAAQQQAVSDADALLRNPDQLFSLRGGQCVLEDTQVDFSAITGVSVDTEEDHHTDDEHADHEQPAHEEAVVDEDHSDIAVQYHFNCDNSAALEQLRFGPDGLPFGLEHINIMWVSESGQGGAEVSINRPYVDF
ncbi:MAG: DUF2796 domain-containing protein [Halieaceae bacterium]|nr:DUF2796 domain-containing protein [Halieaceae bacterium]